MTHTALDVQHELRRLMPDMDEDSFGVWYAALMDPEDDLHYVAPYQQSSVTRAFCALVACKARVRIATPTGMEWGTIVEHMHVNSTPVPCATVRLEGYAAYGCWLIPDVIEAVTRDVPLDWQAGEWWSRASQKGVQDVA